MAPYCAMQDRTEDHMARNWETVRGDIVGGLVSSTVAIPLAMGYGMFAFVALGEKYIADGVLAGFVTSLVVGIANVVLGDKSAAIFAPRVNTTFFTGVLLYGLVNSRATSLTAGGTPLVLAILFSVILLGGVFQALFGLIRLGTLIKFTPHTVMAGFQNAAACLLFLVQLESICGFDRHVAFTSLPDHLAEIKPLTVAIAACTCLAMWNARKFAGKVPPVVVGIVTGTLLYYAGMAAGLAPMLGPVLASPPETIISGMALPYLTAFLGGGAVLQFLPTVIGGALALAIIASIDALLCAKLIQTGDQRIDGDRLLLRLGVGNMASGALGGITGGINIGPSLINRSFGGRSPLSVLVNAAVMIAVSAGLFRYLGYMPRVVLSAVIMVIAIQHLDRWSLSLAWRLLRGNIQFRRHAFLDLSVVLAVATLSIALNIVAAVFVGVGIAIGLFLIRASRSIVRRSYHCVTVHSRKSRTALERQLLEREGSRILVMELQGALFFGSGEILAQQIDAAKECETRIFILDLRRTTEIDSTGAQVLLEIDRDLHRRGKVMFMVFAGHTELAARLTDFAVLHQANQDRIFPDVDRAIECAEERLISEQTGRFTPDHELALAEISLLAQFDPEDIVVFQSFLRCVSYAMDETIFREGDRGTELLMIAKGTASAYLRQMHGHDIRLATFAAGTVFGELAILDEGLRSASVVADEGLVCYSLGTAEFTKLGTEAPDVAIKLLMALGRELSGRLRSANRTIYELEM
jgi:SulP family sulfate permease